MHVPEELQHLIWGRPREGLLESGDEGVAGRNGKRFQGRNHLLVQRPMQTRTEPWGDGRVHARLQDGERAGAVVLRLLLANAAGSAAEAAVAIIDKARKIPGLIMGGADPTLLRYAGGRRFADGGRRGSLRVRRWGRRGRPFRGGGRARRIRVLGTRSGRPSALMSARLRDPRRPPRLVIIRLPLDLNFRSMGSLLLRGGRRGARARAGATSRGSGSAISTIPTFRVGGRFGVRGLGGRRTAVTLPTSGVPAAATRARTAPGTGAASRSPGGFRPRLGAGPRFAPPESCRTAPRGGATGIPRAARRSPRRLRPSLGWSTGAGQGLDRGRRGRRRGAPRAVRCWGCFPSTASLALPLLARRAGRGPGGSVSDLRPAGRGPGLRAVAIRGLG